MYRHKTFIYLALILVLAMTGCFQTESTIEINPDGSGVITSTLNFDNATEEQRQQIKAMMSNPNASSNFNRASFEKDFPSPYFEILELESDQESLRFKSIIKFKDINRLLAVDTQSINLNGVDFEVEGDKLIFKIDKSSQQTGFGSGLKFTRKGGGSGMNIFPKETIRFIDANSNDFIEFSHEYKGDDAEKEIKWKDEIAISGNTIKRSTIKNNFAGYRVLEPVKAEFIKAAWNRTKQPKSTMSQSYLDLELKTALPTAKDSEYHKYLGFDDVYLLSGMYSDGSDVELVETWAKGFRAFNDENNLAGKNNFKLPVYLSFPASPVENLVSTRIRTRLLSGKDLKRVELGQIKPEHTYELPPFKITTGNLSMGDLSLEIKGPVNRINRFLVKTKRENVFFIKESSWTRSDDHGSVRYWKFLPLNNLTLIAEIYDSVEYTWLDVDVPELKLTPEKETLVVREGIDESVETQKQEKQVHLPEDLFKDKSTFENYWTSLTDDQVLPSLLEVSSKMEQLKKNGNIHYWYQAGLVKKLKERKGFFEVNKTKIAKSLFRLFLTMPDQNSNMAITYFLSNGGLIELISDDALEAVKSRKLKNGIDTIFKGELSAEERDIFYDVFEKSDYWVEGLESFKLLTRGPNGDMALAQRTLDDKGQSVHVRQHALEVLIDRKTNFSASDLKPYILHSEMRDWTLNAISNRLGNYSSSNQISKEKLITILKPLIPVFEDLAEHENQYKSDAPKKILAAIKG
ncbi:MAG: hypothetical protein GY777_19360 [Candidatus Brocadiaceae bacterium]|nr:hypothetical protein [Candidatus Brocadiaceae bacterium]